MGPYVSVVSVAKCAVGVLEFERPDNILFVIPHILCISKFEVCVI